MDAAQVYRQLYEEIEREAIELSYSLEFIDDHQNVYSLKIADLILRSCSLIESRLKELHGRNKYDDNGGVAGLDSKYRGEAYLHNTRYRMSKRNFQPFVKMEERAHKTEGIYTFSNVGAEGSQNYSWNNAYQSLRHRFMDARPHYATLKYLFETLATLFILSGDETSKLFAVLLRNKDGSCSILRPSRSMIMEAVTPTSP